MQAELVGFSLASPSMADPAGTKIRAAYIPLATSGVGDLLGGGLAENQIPMREALERLKPLLEDRRFSRSARTSNTTG